MASSVEVKQLFDAEGWTVAEWARKHGFPAGLVYRVLRGETKCRRGTTHQIGIALGIKSPASLNLRKLFPDLCSTEIQMASRARRKKQADRTPSPTPPEPIKENNQT